jgi:3D (Asp-Asp-Asp) domain-containing protein
MRKKFFIIASVVFLIILAVSLILIVINKKKTAETLLTNTEETTNNEVDATTELTATKPVIIPAGTKVQVPTTEAVMKNAAKQIAKIFIERYGTYSTHADFANIKEVESICTQSLWSELSKKIMETTEELPPYQGVTTRVIAMELTDWQTTQATVELSVIKEESKDGSSTTTNQKAMVNLTLSGNDWLVDQFSWQ